MVTEVERAGLRALDDKVPLERRIVVATEPRRRTADDAIGLLPAEAFRDELWQGRIVRGHLSRGRSP